MLIAVGSVVAFTSSAVACEVCSWMGDGFSIAHPRAIEIAVATRDALDAGLIEEWPRTAQTDESIARRIAMLVPGDQTVGDRVIEILCVDDNVTFHFAVRDKRVVASPKPTPAARKLTVVTTGPTAAALAAHRLSLDDAVTRGLVIIERPSGRNSKSAFMISGSGIRENSDQLPAPSELSRVPLQNIVPRNHCWIR